MMVYYLHQRIGPTGPTGGPQGEQGLQGPAGSGPTSRRGLQLDLRTSRSRWCCGTYWASRRTTGARRDLQGQETVQGQRAVLLDLLKEQLDLRDQQGQMELWGLLDLKDQLGSGTSRSRWSCGAYRTSRTNWTYRDQQEQMVMTEHKDPQGEQGLQTSGTSRINWTYGASRSRWSCGTSRINWTYGTNGSRW